MIYHTKSGSIYEVDEPNRRVRSIAKAAIGGRLDTQAWKTFESVDFHGQGNPIYFWWGKGRDEFSADLGTPDDIPEDNIRRCTFTSPVVASVE